MSAQQTPEVPALRRRLRAARRLGRVLGPYRARLAVLVVTSTASVIFETLALAALVPLTTTVAAGADSYTLEVMTTELTISTWQLVTLTLAFVVLKLTLGLFNAAQHARLAAIYELDQRRRGLRAFLRSSWTRQSSVGPGQLQDMLVTVVYRSQAALHALTAAMHAGAGLAIMLTAAFIAGGLAALAIVAALGGLMLLLAPVLARSRRHATRLLVLGQQYARGLEEAALLSQEIKTFGVEEQVVARIDESAEPFSQHRMRHQQLVRSNTLLYEGAGLMLVLGALSALYLLEPGQLSGYAVMALLMTRGLMFGRQLNNQLQEVSDSAPFVTSLENAIASYEESTTPSGSVDITGIDSVRFERVTYTYGGAQSPAVREVDLTITHGDAIGVLGPSGSGKSTFLQLLLLLREPTSGKVLVNGHASGSIAKDSWFDRVNVVPQDPHLFHGTVLENIRFFRPGAAIDSCVEAARRAHIHDEIIAMPDGYDTLLDSRGGSLSGGQRQRVCIARALVGAPDLIVLDEPTSALDAHSEEAIHRTLSGLRGQITLVIVAHRLSTISICNTLMVFRDGALETHGPREDIQANSKYYADVLRLTKLG